MDFNYQALEKVFVIQSDMTKLNPYSNWDVLKCKEIDMKLANDSFYMAQFFAKQSRCFNQELLSWELVYFP